jgi:phosphoribosylglycinamide formyltransferase-1
MRPKIVILISGGGTNMQAIAQACSREEIDADISAVISNRPDAAGLQRAEDAGIETRILDHKDFELREVFDGELIKLIDQFDPQLVVLAGFMRILSADFVRRYKGRLINIHPSLLPKYQGLNTHQRALDANDKEAGVTVHFVTEELDGGPNIIQAVVPVLNDDTASSLQARVHTKEHIIYPLAVKWFIEGRIIMAGQHALLDSTLMPETGLVLED